MTRWEYKVVDLRNRPVTETLNALGDEGWEMVGVGHAWVYFKRPVGVEVR